MKNIKKITIIVCLIMIFTGIKIINDIKRPFNTTTDNISVVVDKGDSFNRIFKKLNKENLIKNKVLFKLYGKYKTGNKHIKPGKYTIDSSTSINEFINILREGKNNNEVKVTIPEGYNIEEIAEVLDKKGIISKLEFLKSCKKYILPDYITADKKVRYQLEGYLFPDTYRFKQGISGEKIIKEMLYQFRSQIKKIEKENNINNKDMKRIITLASIVEKEARIDSDRAKIASVFNNRLIKNMRLQTDATVLYALGKYKKRLSLNDLKVQSPYNTYKIKGLPIGPICNPGKPSIEAIINPAKTKYLYYVLENKKEHYFTDSYSEFLKAKKRYKHKFNIK